MEPSVSSQFDEYDAFAVMEWDVHVAHETSFERLGRLYESAMEAEEPFWVKGSPLAGVQLHQTATLPNKWSTLGHLNGNAICKAKKH